MSISINNVCSRKSYTSSTTSKYEHKSKNAQKSKKKTQIISQKDAKYYYTYIVDEKGLKVLLSKIPIDQVKKQKNLGESTESNEAKSCEDNAVKNDRTAFECNQQMHMEATHRKNLQEVMDILKGKSIKNFE